MISYLVQVHVTICYIAVINKNHIYLSLTAVCSLSSLYATRPELGLFPLRSAQDPWPANVAGEGRFPPM